MNKRDASLREVESIRRDASLREVESIRPAASHDLTVLIPSKNRPEDLAKMLKYFSDEKLPYKIIIVAEGAGYEDICSRAEGLSIELLQLKAKSLAERIVEGLKRVSTPLVTVCSDHDIVFTEAIAKTGGFLMQNVEYSACQGHHGRFCDVNNFELIDILWFTPSLDEAEPLQRLISLIRRYQPICWATFRANALRRIAESFLEYQGELYFELLWSLGAAIEGKVKRLQLLYCLRLLHDTSFKGHPLYLFMESPRQFFCDYSKYSKRLTQHLIEKTGSKENESSKILDLVHLVLFSMAIDAGKINYFIDEMVNHAGLLPSDERVKNSLKPSCDSPPNFGFREVRTSKRSYKIHKVFESAEPQCEIFLEKDFLKSVLKSLDSYGP